MYQTTPLIVVHGDSQAAIAETMRALVSAGMQVVRSFDLQAARAAHTDCKCPHHGTEQCDCQMVMLLVYDRSDQPVTIVAHGHDCETHLAYVDHPDHRPDPHLLAAIRKRLNTEILSKQTQENGGYAG